MSRSYPLKFPSRRPPCFPSESEWHEYMRLAKESAQSGLTYCTDCTPEYQDRMKEQNLCGYHNVYFERVGNSIVGRRRGTMTHDGETLTYAEWAARIGISEQALRERFRKRWTTLRALTTPGKP